MLKGNNKRTRLVNLVKFELISAHATVAQVVILNPFLIPMLAMYCF